MKLGLKYKLSLSILLVIFIFGAAATYAVFVYARETIVGNEEKLLSFYSNEKMNEVLTVFSQASTTSRTISTMPQVERYFSDTEAAAEPLLKLLEPYTQKEEHLSEIFLLDGEGNFLISTNQLQTGDGDFLQRFFEDAENIGKGASAILGEERENVDYYFFSVVESEDKTVGMVVAKLNHEAIKFSNQAWNQSVSEETQIFLVDKNGVVIYSEDQNLLFKSLGAFDGEMKRALGQERAYDGMEIVPMQYDELQGQLSIITSSKLYHFKGQKDSNSNILAVARIGSFPFYVVTEEGANHFNNQAVRIALMLGLFVLFAAFSANILITLLVSRHLRPLSKLKKTAEQITSGKYNQRVDVKTGDEFEELANSFNIMADKLHDNIKNIELVVKERTSDLDKFRLAVENASDHIVITDPEGIILYANRAVEQITGFSREKVLGKKVGTEKNWGGQMKEGFYEELWEKIKKSKEVFVGELQNKRKNGEIYIVKASIAPVLNEKNEVIFFVAIERDITQEKEIDKTKNEFVSLASHQLRTPLSSINWYAEMLLSGDSGELNEAQKEYVLEMYQGNQRMVALVNSLLNVSRLEMETFMVEPKETNLVEMIEDILKEMETEITKKKVEITKDFEEGFPLVKVDPELIKIVFHNIISNAIKYSFKSGTIEISLDKKLKDIIFSVKDHGMGIPLLERHRVFSKLFRADNVRETDTDGSGLGLYMVKSIVDHANGEIWFESEERKRTIFYVSLPLSGMTEKKGTRKLND